MKSDITAGIAKNLRPLFVPDFTAEHVLDIDFKKLHALGIRHILVDLDLTLRKKMSRKLEPKVNKFLIDNFKKYNFESISIASNNILNLERYSVPLQAYLFQPFWRGIRLIRKPNSAFYERILNELRADPKTCVMIGDKLHADVFGGNRAGMLTILVKPNGSDYWFDKILLTRIREHRTIESFKPTKH
ncbi:MAG: putative phosphatase [Patescibacteria group bacterium]|jgi:HAD superfamily phosphatase (TIGR01668 family)|nr:putative phosphatase [Patescibacteria group bacterium]